MKILRRIGQAFKNEIEEMWQSDDGVITLVICALLLLYALGMTATLILWAIDA